jgi:hypothetical protein
MPETRKLVITERKELRRGEDDGRSWVLYGLRATLPDGTPIQHRLSSFEPLPIGEAIEVEISRHEASGSYTLRRPGRGGRSIARLQRELDSLDARVGGLEGRVGRLEAAITPQLPGVQG